MYGAGIKITIDDPEDKVTSDMVPDAAPLMRDGAPDAMVLNIKVRIVADTWFEASPDGLQVSGTTVTRPYTLTIIGQPHALKEGAKFRGGLVSQMESDKVGASVEVTTSRDLTITAVARPQPMTHATPVR